MNLHGTETTQTQCLFLLISEDKRTPLTENKHIILLEDRIVLRSHMHSRMSWLKMSCPRAWSWAKFTPQVIKELLGEEKHGWMNQHSHLTSCSRICMNNATAFHLLHQVREGECSCFGEVTLAEIKLFLMRAHDLQKKAFYWYGTLAQRNS